MFLNPSSILSLFVAGVLGFFVAPHLALVSRVGSRAIKLAAGALALGPAIDFASPMLMSQLYRFNLPLDPLQLIHPLLNGLFWGFLAWSALAVIQSAPARGLP